MSTSRRFFWGRSLAEALARAARVHGIAPERLDYRLRDKRHGFVKHPRAVIVEIDPRHPERKERAGRAMAAPSPPTPPPAAAPAPPSPPHERVAAPPPPPPARERSRAPREAEDDSHFDAPDSESQLAASEAARRLLALAGLELGPQVSAGADGLEVELDGADRERLAAAGVELLDAFEALLPRAVVALAGRRVRVKVDGAGLRAARESELRDLVLAAVATAREQGEALLPPLPPAERRQAHLMLRDVGGLDTESLGRGTLKRVRIFVVPG